MFKFKTSLLVAARPIAPYNQRVIHEASRKRLREALRHYVAGLITNDQLDDIEVDWRDTGAAAVKERSWFLYDDLSEHRAVDEHKIGPEVRREICRWILFLQSGQEYHWPPFSFITIVNWPLNWLTLGWWERRKLRLWNEFTAAGKFNVWPFLQEREFELALRHPRFFSGGEPNNLRRG